MDISFTNSVIAALPFGGAAAPGGTKVRAVPGFSADVHETGSGHEEQATALPLERVADSASISTAGLEALKREAGSQAAVAPEETAPAAAAGSLASGGPSYGYQRGPDGVAYAVGGEVGISVGSGSTPQERVANAERAQRAATAPANPSGADRAVAAHAAEVAASARAEVAEQHAAKVAATKEEAPSATPADETAPVAENGTPRHDELPGKSNEPSRSEVRRADDREQQVGRKQERAQAYADTVKPRGRASDVLGKVFG